MTLGLKLGRRLMGAVVVDDEQCVLRDSRFVTARTADRAVAVTRYLTQLLDQAPPTAIYYYAPTGVETVTTSLVEVVQSTAGARGIPVRPLTRLDVFGSFGVTPFRTRRDLRDHLVHFWPELAEGQPHRREVLAEAAAAALVGQLYEAWPLI